MKFSVEQSVLVKEFDFLRRANPSNESGRAWLMMEVPSELPHEFVMTASNSRCSLVSRLSNRSVVDRTAGKFPVTTTKLEEMARAIGSQILSFERVNNAMTMSWDTGRMKVMAPYDIYHPVFPLGQMVSEVHLDTVPFMTALSKLRFCYPPPTEMRVPGIKFDIAGQLLTVTSTTGTAIGVMALLMEHASADASFVLPVTITDDLFALLRDNKSEPLVLQFFEKHLTAACGHRTYTTAYLPITQPYPNVTRLITLPTSIKADFPVDLAKQALRRASACSSYEHDESKRVEIALLEGSIVLGTLESAEAIGTYEGQSAVKFIVNRKLLSGVLDGISTPSVEINGSSNASPWLFTPKGGSDVQFVLAPMSAL